jgi:hypothetical protein
LPRIFPNSEKVLWPNLYDVARITTFKWAINKANLTMEALTLHLEGTPLRDSEANIHHDNHQQDTSSKGFYEEQSLGAKDHTQDGRAQKSCICFTDDTRNQDAQDTKEILMAPVKEHKC